MSGQDLNKADTKVNNRAMSAMRFGTNGWRNLVAAVDRARAINARSTAEAKMTVYQLSDRLHEGRTVQVPADGIAPTVSAWLAELGAASPLVEGLARAVRAGDWPAIHGTADYLAVEVTVAA